MPNETRIREIFREELARAIGGASTNFHFDKHVQLFDGRNIQTGRTTGTQIATASDQKLSFFGATPIAQPAAPTDEASIISTLQDLGLTA